MYFLISATFISVLHLRRGSHSQKSTFNPIPGLLSGDQHATIIGYQLRVIGDLFGTPKNYKYFYIFTSVVCCQLLVLINLSIRSFSFYAAVRPGYYPGTEDVYKMTTLPRGIALIINNNWFADHPVHGQQLPRQGTEEDVRQVEALFAALGFNVHAKENLTRKELLDELDSLACSNHSDCDCFVLWLMSHGKSGEVFCSDGKTLPIQVAHDLFSKCDTLSGKPKLFFIQACRGDEEDEGVTFTADISSPVQLTSSHVDSPTDTVKRPVSRVPTHADFLYSFSTVDEHVSYRHMALGSYYVRALVEAFQERSAHDHLLDILTIVNQKVSDMEATMASVANKNDIKIFKQMPEVKHTLRKKVRF